MNIINRTLRRFALGAVAAASALLSQAEASPVVSVSPSTQTIGVGGHAIFDILVSGVNSTDPTGGFSLTLGVLNSIVSGVSFLNDPDGKMGAAPLDLSGGFTAGSLDLFFAADASANLATLAASEDAGFRLASLDFLGVADGLSALTLSNVVLSNWDGSADLLGVGTNDGSVCVGSCAPTVPEPGSILLAATALGALALRQRKSA